MPEAALSPDSPRTAMIVSRAIEENLPPTRTGSAFRQKLQDLCARSAQDGADLVSIAQLPALACAAIGGDSVAAEPITAAWQLVRLAAKLLDDVEDREIGTETSVAVNAATALLNQVMPIVACAGA